MYLATQNGELIADLGVVVGSNSETVSPKQTVLTFTMQDFNELVKLEKLNTSEPVLEPRPLTKANGYYDPLAESESDTEAPVATAASKKGKGKGKSKAVSKD